MNKEQYRGVQKKKAPDFSDASFSNSTEQLPAGGITSGTSGNPYSADTQGKDMKNI